MMTLFMNLLFFTGVSLFVCVCGARQWTRGWSAKPPVDLLARKEKVPVIKSLSGTWLRTRARDYWPAAALRLYTPIYCTGYYYLCCASRSQIIAVIIIQHAFFATNSTSSNSSSSSSSSSQQGRAIDRQSSHRPFANFFYEPTYNSSKGAETRELILKEREIRHQEATAFSHSARRFTPRQWTSRTVLRGGGGGLGFLHLMSSVNSSFRRNLHQHHHQHHHHHGRRHQQPSCRGRDGDNLPVSTFMRNL